jgi:hypothetical protein
MIDKFEILDYLIAVLGAVVIFMRLDIIATYHHKTLKSDSYLGLVGCESFLTYSQKHLSHRHHNHSNRSHSIVGLRAPKILDSK